MSDTGYMGNSSLKRTEVQISYTQEQVLELAKCASDPIYFVDNYCYIVTLDHGLQPFKLYDCQKEKNQKDEPFHNSPTPLVFINLE